MHFFTTTSVAVLAALATVSEAIPHGRPHVLRRWAQAEREEVDPPATVTVYPVPEETPPLSTGSFPGTGGPIKKPEEPTQAPISTETLTLTYTLGTGTSTRVVTTTVDNPVYPEPAEPTQTADKPGESPPGEDDEDDEDDEDENERDQETTTLSSTSTTTQYITVNPRPTDSGPGEGGDGDGDGCVPVTVTETTTESVTVTAQPSQPTGDDDDDDDDDGDDGDYTLVFPTSIEPPVEEPEPSATRVPPPVFATPSFPNGTTPTFPTTRPSSGFSTVIPPGPTAAPRF